MGLLTCSKLTVMVVLMVSSTSGFVLQDKCIVPPGCSCFRRSRIYCQNNSMTDIPDLGSVTSSRSSYFIYLNNNKITSVPANAFQGIIQANPSVDWYDFELQNNMITRVDPDAFAGLENITTGIYIADNQLVEMPSALLKLNRVHAFFAEGNPLMSIDPVIMQHLGQTVTAFGIDMRNLKTWPSVEISALHHLREIEIQHIPWSHLPLDAFSVCDPDLKCMNLNRIRLLYSQLTGLPAAVCSLQALNELTITDNVAQDSDFSSPCSNKLTRMMVLILNRNGMTKFPNVLETFPGMLHLLLDDNNIRSIDSSAIPAGHGLQTLYLRHNQLVAIPTAIVKLTRLERLYLSGNQITTLEDNSFLGLINLKVLELNENPIVHVSPQAFQANSGLTSLYLNSTSLRLIPDAVRLLPRLDNLYFQNNSAECSCRLDYLKRWHVGIVSDLRGNCENQTSHLNDGIKRFLLTTLPSCP